MADFVSVPHDRIDASTLTRLLEEFCSRDGTDYGHQETALDTRVAQLRARLRRGEAKLLFDADSESWDIVAAEQAQTLLLEGQ